MPKRKRRRRKGERKLLPKKNLYVGLRPNILSVSKRPTGNSKGEDKYIDLKKKNSERAGKEGQATPSDCLPGEGGKRGGWAPRGGGRQTYRGESGNPEKGL